LLITFFTVAFQALDATPHRHKPLKDLVVPGKREIVGAGGFMIGTVDIFDLDSWSWHSRERLDVCQLQHKYIQVVIDRKRIFLCRPKMNIWQENTAAFSADNEYSAQGSKHHKNVNL
jgi:hypothetical protein